MASPEGIKLQARNGRRISEQNLANACIGVWDCVRILIPLEADESLKPADVPGICFGTWFEPWAGQMWYKDLNSPQGIRTEVFVPSPYPRVDASCHLIEGVLPTPNTLGLRLIAKKSNIKINVVNIRSPFFVDFLETFYIIKWAFFHFL